MESFFNTDLRNFAQEDGLIKQHQFAYSKFSSTTVALFRVVDYLKHVIIDFVLSADDTEIHFSFKDVGKTEYRIHEDLKSIKQWFSDNGLICNTKKTVTMVIASHRAVKTAGDVRIYYGDLLLEQKRSFKHLGVIVDESLPWSSHISYVASRFYPKLK